MHDVGKQANGILLYEQFGAKSTVLTVISMTSFSGRSTRVCVRLQYIKTACQAKFLLLLKVKFYNE